jgi:hypothetical protein
VLDWRGSSIHLIHPPPSLLPGKFSPSECCRTGGKQPDDVDEQPPRNDHGALVLHLRVRDAQRDLHVGRRKVQLAAGGAQHDPGEDLDVASGAI